ncbi:PRC-barrel domain-containing protein [Clostridium sp. 'deep sea']|uniref:PRC-barrel domain-containing protein n=1 Tax=Clostridium sp. 'deep sea' TaxID=2779445 RepID=UPI0018966DCA|nr:PRC-barrel domain-containing protein [Clostridium sp. 'deep sea']QOR35697.1 PRC-barrel domain-containing protein [Clostridium sp. 'deep sea']
MKRIKDILNLPVIALDTGQKIGSVIDVIYSVSQRRLIGLLIEKVALINSKLVITPENIINIGNDTVTITSNNALYKPSSIPDVYQAMAEQGFNNQRLISRAGDELGIIDDLVIDENSGILVALDISGGIISDLIYGRKRIELPNSFSLSKSNCILQKGVKDESLLNDLSDMW